MCNRFITQNREPINGIFVSVNLLQQRTICSNNVHQFKSRETLVLHKRYEKTEKQEISIRVILNYHKTLFTNLLNKPGAIVFSLFFSRASKFEWYRDIYVIGMKQFGTTEFTLFMLWCCYVISQVTQLMEKAIVLNPFRIVNGCRRNSLCSTYKNTMSFNNSNSFQQYQEKHTMQVDTRVRFNLNRLES